MLVNQEKANTAVSFSTAEMTRFEELVGQFRPSSPSGSVELVARTEKEEPQREIKAQIVSTGCRRREIS